MVSLPDGEDVGEHDVEDDVLVHEDAARLVLVDLREVLQRRRALVHVDRVDLDNLVADLAVAERGRVVFVVDLLDLVRLHRHRGEHPVADGLGLGDDEGGEVLPGELAGLGSDVGAARARPDLLVLAQVPSEVAGLPLVPHEDPAAPLAHGVRDHQPLVPHEVEHLHESLVHRGADLRRADGHLLGADGDQLRDVLPARRVVGVEALLLVLLAVLGQGGEVALYPGTPPDVRGQQRRPPARQEGLDDLRVKGLLVSGRKPAGHIRTTGFSS